MLFLPECAAYMGVELGEEKGIGLLQPLTDGEVPNAFKQMAKENNIWMSIGGCCFRTVLLKLTSQKGFSELDEKREGMGFISHFVVNNEGTIVNVYRKTHLFEVEIPGGRSFSLFSEVKSFISPQSLKTLSRAQFA